MDFHGSSGSSINNIGMWDWQDEDCCLARDSRLGLSHCPWDDDNRKNECLLNVLVNQTPIRDCGLDVIDAAGKTKRGLEEHKEASQVKRRRVLRFPSVADGATADNGQPSSAPVRSKGDSMVVDGWPENLQWNPIWSSDDSFLFSKEVLDQSSDEWLENYFNDSDMYCSSNEMSSSNNEHIEPNDQVDVADFCNVEPDTRTIVIPKTPKASTVKIFTGRRSHINSPTKLTTSVAYPFSLVKPSEVQGHLTLKDINQRIHAPPPSRSFDKKDNNPSIIYPTSAFSGKPVVVKTKILTQGGKGSITILRTKG
ncbi:protein XRI1-like isoform X2 [Musa acuminata AAA Group]|uniref:protein XRI1-like isoform X2 n=1 Tax=Musa acuminata AAA Group TaxID=214697 RepID=UPI0031E39333